MCMNGVGVTCLSNWNPHSSPAFFSDLADECLAPTSNYAVTSALMLALPQGS